jgi:hypothetical protein
MRMPDDEKPSYEALVLALGEMLDTVYWMSGSNDFSPDGVAAKGWEKAQVRLRIAEDVFCRARASHADMEALGPDYGGPGGGDDA